MATNNSIVNKSGSLTLDPGASGDSFVQFDINTTGEFRIGVDDTDDSFRISQGSALGTSDTFVMTATGERTMPLNPAFLAYRSSGANDVTGDGTKYTIIWNAERFDQNGDFDTSTGTFTAPVTGRYRLDLAVWFDDVTSSHTSSNIEIVTSNRTYYGGTYNLNARRVKDGTADQVTVYQRVLADMDLGDTCTTTATVSNGTKVVDVESVGATQTRGSFNGSLVC